MYLTREEENILNGEYGTTLQKAIEILVALGDIYGADSLIPIKSAQIAGVSYKTIGDAGLEWISSLKGTVKVPSVLNPAGMDLEDWAGMGIPESFAIKQKEIIKAYSELGIRVECTCTPYYLQGFDLSLGEHIAWSESSAVSYANSVIGARTNREGGPSALSAALIGKTGNYGFHLDQNRVPTISVNVECDISSSDYGALGYIVGKMISNKVPLFNLKSNPKKVDLKSLGAAMAASGSVALYHVKNVTPEQLHMNFDTPEETIVIEEEQIREVYESKASFKNNCDIVALGCPHCSVEELEEIASLLEGKTVNKEFWVCTSREVANNSGDIISRIEKSGAKVLCDTCMVVSPASENYRCMAVNSGKAFNYIPGMCKIESMYATLEECIDEAGDRN
ncbi:aconitase X catalytic domain-containing protein [Methanosalsum natronophilum]|uniref:aconitase X catalytic domain-containing protein n=1 Tax=Methanosalsum natronophilum TaxID=768733 RepID=UPI00216950A2|nr:aconitase X catalytic domain-containing protein [Methanosalsum natronophilum]MCS3923673.1 putative aconitase [Methanosalsum natronophilum]